MNGPDAPREAETAWRAMDDLSWVHSRLDAMKVQHRAISNRALHLVERLGDEAMAWHRALDVMHQQCADVADVLERARQALGRILDV